MSLSKDQSHFVQTVQSCKSDMDLFLGMEMVVTSNAEEA